MTTKCLAAATPQYQLAECPNFAAASSQTVFGSQAFGDTKRCTAAGLEMLATWPADCEAQYVLSVTVIVLMAVFDMTDAAGLVGSVTTATSSLCAVAV